MESTTRFDDDEIRRILTRAAERQEQAERALPAAEDGSRSGDHPGLTLAELQSVAQEVGIAPAHVVAAARDVQLRPTAAVERYRIVGIPKATEDHLVVPGTLGDREWEAVVGALREEFRVPGTVSSFGDVREWWSSSMSTAGGVRVRLEPGEDGTEITFRRSNRHISELYTVLGATFGGLGGFAGLMVAINASGPGRMAGPIVLGGLTTLFLVAGRFMAKWSAKRDRSRFRRLLDRIDLMLRRGG